MAKIVKNKKKKPKIPMAMQEQIMNFEKFAAQKGINIHYDILEAAGFKLKGGICNVNGELHLFIDRRLPPSERIESLKEHLEKFLPSES